MNVEDGFDPDEAAQIRFRLRETIKFFSSDTVLVDLFLFMLATEPQHSIQLWLFRHDCKLWRSESERKRALKRRNVPQWTQWTQAQPSTTGRSAACF